VFTYFLVKIKEKKRCTFFKYIYTFKNLFLLGNCDLCFLPVVNMFIHGVWIEYIGYRRCIQGIGRVYRVLKVTATTSSEDNTNNNVKTNSDVKTNSNINTISRCEPQICQWGCKMILISCYFSITRSPSMCWLPIILSWQKRKKKKKCGWRCSYAGDYRIIFLCG